MNVLVLLPSFGHLNASLFCGSARRPSAAARFPWHAHSEAAAKDVADVVRRDLAETWLHGEAGVRPDAVGVRVPYGGRDFAGATRLTQAALERLRRVGGDAPLHIPPLVRSLEACLSAFPHTPVLLAFETAFFSRLPVQETAYGLAPESTSPASPSRVGFHGLFHAAACAHAAAELRASGLTRPARLLSICLEPRPEVAAVHGQTPWMVTGGATPLEGLPGHTTCGEVDPSVVLFLAEHLRAGPEQIDRMLTRQSGLLGLVGRRVTLDSLWREERPDLRLARRLMEYRLLLACGSGVAALGGLDGLVFSGRFADLADVLGTELCARLRTLPGLRDRPLPSIPFREPLDTVIADLVRMQDQRA